MASTALTRIRLRHLQCFLAVARLGNLRRAAEALSITQPAVTKTINELEEILAVRLFERGRGGALLTREAEVFLRHANASVNALSQAVDSMTRERGNAILSVGALPSIAATFVPRALQRFRRESPQVHVRIHTGANAEMLAQLRRKELDVLIGRLSEPEQMSGLTFEHLYAEPLVIAVRPAHPLLSAPQYQPQFALDDLARFEMVLPLAGTIIRYTAESFLGTHGIVPQLGHIETLSVPLAQRYLQSSDALWFTPHSTVQPDVEQGLLRCLPVGMLGTEEPVGILLRADTLPSAALQGLLEAVRGVDVGAGRA